MPSPVPTPVAAAIGLVPTVLDRVRRLPGKAVQLPVVAVGSALTALGTARREYQALAERGEQLVARLRGTSVDEVEDLFEQRLDGTPLEAAYDGVEDALEKLSGTTLRSVTDAVDAVEKALWAVPEDAQHAQPPQAEAPKGVPTPKASEPAATRVGTAATVGVVETVEQVVAAMSVPTVESRDELPLADYDHLTLGSLRGRLRSLTVPELVQIRAYELTHADRLPVVTMLDNRIARLATDAASAPAARGDVVEPTSPAPVGKRKTASPTRSKRAAKTSPKGAATPRTKARST